METQNSPLLAVGDGAATIGVYEEAFGATKLWRLDAGSHIGAGLSVRGAELFLADEPPAYRTRARTWWAIRQ